MTREIDLWVFNGGFAVGGSAQQRPILFFHCLDDPHFLILHQLSGLPLLSLTLVRCPTLLPFDGTVYLTPSDMHLGATGNSVRFPFRLIILVKIDDNLPTRFMFDVLYGANEVKTILYAIAKLKYYFSRNLPQNFIKIEAQLPCFLCRKGCDVST